MFDKICLDMSGSVMLESALQKVDSVRSPVRAARGFILLHGAQWLGERRECQRVVCWLPVARN